MHAQLYFIISLMLVSSGRAQQGQPASAGNFVGERLEFQMQYLNMSAATLVFEMREDSNFYHLRVAAKSTGKATIFFSLDNVYEAMLMKQNLLPVRIEKTIRQKNIARDVVIQYDHETGIASLADSVRWPIPADCYHYFSMLYFFRTIAWDQVDLQRLHLDSEYIISAVDVSLQPEPELTTTPAGQFSTRRLELAFTPQSDEARPWKTDLLTNRLAKPGSEVTFWFSDDEARLPVKISYGNSAVKTVIVLTSFSRGARN
ncbi:MAG: DUF3108 domain-containing protein [Candidatus Zhuqueibacterota bacterium]